MDIHPLPSILQKTEGAVLPNVFQNGFNSSRGAAPSEEPEPEPFSEEPEPCQTGPETGPNNVYSLENVHATLQTRAHTMFHLYNT